MQKKKEKKECLEKLNKIVVRYHTSHVLTLSSFYSSKIMKIYSIFALIKTKH
jgi:hypothetical protein